jgi:hypothetical protein
MSHGRTDNTAQNPLDRGLGKCLDIRGQRSSITVAQKRVFSGGLSSAKPLHASIRLRIEQLSQFAPLCG